RAAFDRLWIWQHGNFLNYFWQSTVADAGAMSNVRDLTQNLGIDWLPLFLNLRLLDRQNGFQLASVPFRIHLDFVRAAFLGCEGRFKNAPPPFHWRKLHLLAAAGRR